MILLTLFPKLTSHVAFLHQCSVPCGYGIQSRPVSCLGPTKPEPLSPLLCMHMPKPITIQGCNLGICVDVSPTAAATQAVPMVHLTDGPLLSPTSPTEAIAFPQPTTAAIPTPRGISSLTPDPFAVRVGCRCRVNSVCSFPGACGQLLLEESGRVDLKNVATRCTVSIGRPLDEVIHIRVESSSLNCRKSMFFLKYAKDVTSCAMIYCTKNNCLYLCACVPAEEYVAFFDRLAFVRKCEQVAGSELTTRTNVLLVRQNMLTPGNGIVFSYTSQKNLKRSHHQGEAACLFSVCRAALKKETQDVTVQKQEDV